ncbi:DnaD domain-containing protein [Streptococcus sp. sy004]|uniref:DnaD domain-containing protein n=1 Tax=Streptococcus sp. sy004 TaxID=2600149 RepID=UPI0011B6994B|nr:DnaD domain-containing protein [Streptococcus sp. sy004]TWT10394.1 DnaD domain-containing protein [Streptococcus sp. sy004]
MSFLEQYQKGQLVLPASLLLRYRQLFSKADDFLVWQFFYLQNTTKYDELPPDQIAAALGWSVEAVNQSITNLLTQELMAIRSINLNGLEETIFDTSLALKKLDQLDKNTKAVSEQEPSHQNSQESLPSLLADFDQAGWVLTSFELEDIQKWLQEEQLSPDLIREALRESVYSGTRNWRYLSKILLNWQREGIRSLADIEQRREERERLQPERTSTPIPSSILDTMDKLWG